MPDRAQSETVGAILLLGVVVLSVGVVGAYALEAAIVPSDAPRANVAGDVRTDALVLTHQGGDALPGGDLRLRVRVNGSETGVAWADGTLTGGDDRFDPGEEWRVTRAYAPGAVVSVRLVHVPSNAVVFRTETSPPRPTVVGDGGKADARDTEGEIPVGADEDDGSLRVRVDDLTDRDRDRPHYVVSYDVAPANDSFEGVEVAFTSDDVDATGTESGTGTRGHVRFQRYYGSGAEYDLVVRTLYRDESGGTVVGRSRTITDRADAVNPSNDDLSEADSPTIDASTTIDDLSEPNSDRVRYEFDYAVTTRGNFQQVVLGVVNQQGVGGTDVRFGRPAGKKETITEYYGTGTQYKATILVFDADGAVVDAETRIDEADGDDAGDGPGPPDDPGPPGNPGPPDSPGPPGNPGPPRGR
jgi:hypothetical protein